MVTINDGADSIAKISQQVPSVRNLHGLRCTLTNTIGVSTSAIACDHLYTRMLTKPRGERLGLPVREQIHDLVPLEVDKDGAVVVATSPGPVIHAKHLRRRR